MYYVNTEFSYSLCLQTKYRFDDDRSVPEHAIKVYARSSSSNSLPVIIAPILLGGKAYWGGGNHPPCLPSAAAPDWCTVAQQVRLPQLQHMYGYVGIMQYSYTWLCNVS